jgi:hypothetical protein
MSNPKDKKPLIEVPEYEGQCIYCLYPESKCHCESDAESDHSEPFENDGAYADDDNE